MDKSKLNYQKNLLLIIVVLFWFAQYVYVPFQTPYLSTMQVSSSMIGIIIGIYGFSQMVLRMPIGIMADKNGRHKLFIILGVTASALASVFRIILEPQTGFLVGNILSGFASAMWISFMVLYASYFTYENLQRAMGLIMAANNIGVLGGFVLSTLSYNHLGILMATCMSFTTQIAHEINASAFQIGLLSIVYIIVAVLASYFSASNFARRLGSSLWIPFILFVLAIYCFAVPNIFSPNLLIAIQILAGLSTGIVFSFCTSEAMKNVPIEKRSTAMGYYQAIYAVGMTIVPMIAGNIAEIYNLNIAFYLEGIIAVIATVASMIYFKYDNRKIIKG